MSRVGNKKMNKKAFALVTTIFLIILFSVLSLQIAQTNLFSSNLNMLKYYHIQATIHMDSIKEFVQNNAQQDINNYKLDDDRFVLDIKSTNENNTTRYHIYVEATSDIPVRLTQTLVK